MTADKINALLASAYNLHIGPHVGGEPMTEVIAIFKGHHLDVQRQ
jgi:hypothetical protein